MTGQLIYLTITHKRLLDEILHILIRNYSATDWNHYDIDFHISTSGQVIPLKLLDDRDARNALRMMKERDGKDYLNVVVIWGEGMRDVGTRRTEWMVVVLGMRRGRPGRSKTE
jgi:hypothetical protein